MALRVVLRTMHVCTQQEQTVSQMVIQPAPTADAADTPSVSEAADTSSVSKANASPSVSKATTAAE